MKTSALVATALFLGPITASSLTHVDTSNYTKATSAEPKQSSQIEINPEPSNLYRNPDPAQLSTSYRLFQHSVYTAGEHLNINHDLSTSQMTQLGQMRVKKIFDQLKSAPVDPTTGNIILDERAYKPLLMYYSDEQSELWGRVTNGVNGDDIPFTSSSPILSTFSYNDNDDNNDTLMAAARGCWISEPPKKSPLGSLGEIWPVSAISRLFSDDDNDDNTPNHDQNDIITPGTLITAPVTDVKVGYETSLMLLAAKIDQEWARNAAMKRMVQDFQRMDDIWTDDQDLLELLEDGRGNDQEQWFWAQQGSTKLENHGHVKQNRTHILHPGNHQKQEQQPTKSESTTGLIHVKIDKIKQLLGTGGKR